MPSGNRASSFILPPHLPNVHAVQIIEIALHGRSIIGHRYVDDVVLDDGSATELTELATQLQTASEAARLSLEAHF